MTNFVYDNLALPDDKVDSDGGSSALTNPTRQWSANDSNRVFQGLEDIRGVIRGNIVSVTSYGALPGSSVTTGNAAAFQAALDAAAATVTGTFGAIVDVPKGLYILDGQITIPNGVGLRGSGPASTILRAKDGISVTSLVANDDQGGTQEFFFMEGIAVEGNKGGGATCSVAVVDIVSLFINSYVRDVVVSNGSNVGLRVAGANGMGPVFFENLWVLRNDGHNILVEEVVGNTHGTNGLYFCNIASEHQGTNSSALYLKGLGHSQQWNFHNIHIEQGTAATGRTAITIDGVSHVLIDGVQLEADLATVSNGIVITNVVQNVGIQIRAVTNQNLINPVLDDQKNSVTLGAINVNSYCTADFQQYGGPQYTPVSGGKSIVFQSSAQVDRAWFDGNGRLTGASVNGAGIDILADATNNRAMTLMNNDGSSIFELIYPSGGGGVIRFVRSTSSTDVFQVGTNGTLFIYESPTFQKTATFQQGLRLSAEISPPQITANQNNYSPTGLSTAVTMLLTSDASRDITGIVAQSSGILWVYNIGAQNIVLKHESASSTAANRIIGTAGADVTLTPNRAVMLRYSASQTRWLVMTDNL